MVCLSLIRFTVLLGLQLIGVTAENQNAKRSARAVQARWQTTVKYNPNCFMERSSASQQLPTGERRVILDRNKLVLMNKWMNGHRGRVGHLNMTSITALCRLYLPSTSPISFLTATSLLSPFRYGLFPFFLSGGLAGDKRSKSANRPIYRRIRRTRVGRSKNIDGLIFDRRGNREPDRRLSASHTAPIWLIADQIEYLSLYLLMYSQLLHSQWNIFSICRLISESGSIYVALDRHFLENL